MKPTNKLTELACKKANAVGKKLTDGNGMYLLVHKNGSKYWRMDYQLYHPYHGLQLMLLKYQALETVQNNHPYHYKID